MISALHSDCLCSRHTLLRRGGRVQICLAAVSVLLLFAVNVGLAKAAARAETSPSGVVDQANGEQWVFWVTSEGEVAYWHRASSTEGWVKRVLGGNVKAGSSPAAVGHNENVYVYYVNTRGEIANWTYSGGVWQGRAFGGAVAENTSPSAGANPAGTIGDVSYVNTSREIATFYYNGREWLGPTALGGRVKAHTSPAVVVWESGETFVYYVNSEDEIANWTYHSGWIGRPFGGKVAEDSSPSAASNTAASVMLVSYINSGKEVEDFLDNGIEWVGPSKIGGEAKAGSSTSTMMTKSSEVLVYYVKKNGEVASWTLSGATWTAATRGGEVEKNTSPSAAIYLEKGYQYIFFSNSLAEISDFAFEAGSWSGPTVL
jgi:hypothetical protein